MSFDYSELQNNAIELIAEYGRDVTYRSFNSGTYDPDSGTVSGDDEAETTVKAVVTTAKIEKIDGTALQRGDRFFLIASGSVVPNAKDAIIDGGETYQIVDFTEIKPGDSIMAYKIQARK